MTLDNYLPLLFKRNKEKYERIFSPSTAQLHKKVDFDIKSDENICELLFYHLLFTSSDAIDCNKGGILEIPYFWHWCDPNPRYELVYIPESKKLNKVPPPKGYTKYKSYADIDRTPAIYLKNLFEEKPLFHHPVCGDMFTFGWCSEREMAFNSILKLIGYECKIKQEGIHVWSEIFIKLKKDKTKYENYVIKVDNTFNGFEINEMHETKEEWKRDFGSGTQVIWYNTKSHSAKEIQMVKRIEISETADKRIQKKVKNWLDKL